MVRGMLAKNLDKSIEFVVHNLNKVTTRSVSSPADLIALISGRHEAREGPF